jgi:hypothetical protein
MKLDISFTIKVIIIAVIALLVITAWDEVIDRCIFKFFNLDRESISSWIIIAVISTVLLIVILLIFGIEVHDLIGIDETVDVQLTGKTESIVNGKVVHE